MLKTYLYQKSKRLKNKSRIRKTFDSDNAQFTQLLVDCY